MRFFELWGPADQVEFNWDKNEMNQKCVDWVTELSEHFGRMVYATAYRVLGNHQDAEDILQDVFLKLLGGWGKRIQPETVRDWGAYLRVTALRCAIAERN